MTVLDRYPHHLLASTLVAGLAFANVAHIHTVGLAVVGVALVFVLGDPRSTVRFTALAVALAAFGWWWGSGRLERLDRSVLSAHVADAGRFEAVVTAPAKVGRYRIRVFGAVRGYEGRRVREPVLLELPLGRSPPQGAVIQGAATVRAPRGPADGFDERTWLRHQGVHVIVRYTAWRQVGRRGGVGGVADRIHAWLGAAIACGVTGERRALLVGIVLGDDGGLSQSTKEHFQASGLYHLLAVSGQNVVLVAAGVLVLAWLVGVARGVGEVGALVGIAAYVLAVGAQPSVVRAGVAGALASIAWLTGRLGDAWYALALGAVVLLGWNPMLVFDPGFELSFAAVGAIFAVAPRVRARLAGYPLPDHLQMAIAVSGACGLVTAPILWFRFGQLPLLTIPANVLAEPAMPIVLTLAFATAALGPVTPAGAAFLSWCNGWVVAYIGGCARLIGSVPGAQITVTNPLAGPAVAVAIALVLGVVWAVVRVRME